MGRSVDHLVADCYPGWLPPYLNISTLKASHRFIANPLQKKKKKKAREEETLVTLSKSAGKYKTS